MGFLVGSGISWTICKQSAPCSRQITTATPHHLFFYRPDALPDAQPTPLWTRCWFLCTKCSKTRLRASLVPKVSRGFIPRTSVKREGGRVASWLLGDGRPWLQTEVHDQCEQTEMVVCQRKFRTSGQSRQSMCHGENLWIPP